MRIHPLLGALACVAIALPSRADESWTNTGGTFSWNLNTNWNPQTVPGIADLATFTDTGFGTVTLDASQSAKGLVFTNTAAAPYTFSSGAGTNTLTLGASGISSTTAGAVTINPQIILQAAQNWTLSNSSAVLTVGAVSFGTLQLNIGTGSTTATASLGTINFTDAFTGSGILSINSTGLTVLSGNSSTYTGNINILNAGTLRVTNIAALGNGGLLNTNTGAGAGIARRIELYIDGPGSNGIISTPRTIGGNSGITTTIDVNNSTGLATGNTGNQIAFTGALTTSAIGTSTINITGGNGYSLLIANVRNTAGTAGLLTFNPTTAALTIGNFAGNQSSGSNTLGLGGSNPGNAVTGVIANGGSATASILKTGTGTWVLSGANTYTGTTTVGAAAGANAGILQFSGTGKIGTGAVSVLAGTLDLNGTTQTISALNLGTGAAASTATVTLGSGGVVNLGGDVAFTSTNNPLGAVISGGTVNLNATRTFTIADSTNAAIDTTVSSALQDGTASSGITKAGAGRLLLSGANTYTGGTAINAGVLQFATIASLPTTGTVAVGATGTLVVNAGGTGEFNFATSGPDSFGDLLAGTVNGAAITYAAGAVVGVDTTNAAANSTYAGDIANSSAGARGFLKLGANALTLSADQTYTGPTTLSAGGLVLPGSNGAMSGNLTVANGATLQLQATVANTTAGVSNAAGANTNARLGLANGSTLQLRSDTAVTFAGTNGITSLNAATVTIDVNQLTAGNTNNVLTLSPGTSPFGNAVTFNVTGGNGYSLALGAIQNITGSASNFTLNPTTAAVSLGSYSNNFSSASASNSTLTLSGTAAGNAVTGAIINQAAGSLGTGNVAVVKSGSSTWTLSGANTYTGATSVLSGTLVVTSSGTLGAAAGSGLLTLGSGVAATQTAASVANLTLNNDATVSGLTVAFNTTDTTSAGNVGLLSIASGKTLTVNGVVSVGVAPSTAGSTTNIALSTGTAGTGGTLTVNGNFNAGVTGGANANLENAVIDLSGLTAFNQTATSGTLNVGSGYQDNARLILPATATVNVATISVGDSAGQNYSNATSTALVLGGGASTLNATTIVIGNSKGGGAIQFAGAAGSVTIAGLNGTGAANINLGVSNGGATYQFAGTNGLLLAGHTANVTAGAVVISQETSQTAGNASSQITFDTGTFTANSVEIAKFSGGSRDLTGSLVIGTNAASTGTFTVNAGTGNHFYLANKTGGTAASIASFTVNGGTATLNVDLSDASTTGTSTTTLTLAGGTLDLTGHVIGGDGTTFSTLTQGSGRAIGTINLQAGVLQNVLKINGGSTALSKTTSGTLQINGANAYTNALAVTAGTLAGTQTAGAAPVTVNTGGTLRPGNPTATGTLTSSANVTFDSGSNFGVRVTAAGTGFTGANFGASGVAGTDNNYLVTSGTLAIPATGLTVTIDASGTSFDPTGNTVYSYKIAQAGTLTGISVGTPLTSPDVTFVSPGLTASNYSLATDGNGNLFVQFQPAAVPEPATVMSVATLGFFGLRRFRRLRAC